VKIGLVCNEYPPAPHGGIGTFVHILAHGLAARGHDVSVVGLADQPEERDDQGVHVVMLKRPRLPNWLIDRRPVLRYLRDQVAAGRFDIIETPDFLGPVPCRLGDCPVIVRLHNTATAMALHRGRLPRPSNRRRERGQLRAHGNWIAVSRHALNLTLHTFRGCTPQRQAVIYSPVTGGQDMTRPPPDLPDDFILHAGHVVARKGVIVLAHAARRFLEEFPNLHLVYAGGVLREDRPRADVAIRDILGPHLSRRCHLLGYLDRATVLHCMRRARAFAFPSTIEMFPLVVVEAMTQGCPVVASGIPPFDEIITHNHNGLLANPARPADFAAAVTRVLRDPSLARSMADNARAFVAQCCSLDRHLDATLSFYQQCLADRTQPTIAPAEAPACAPAF
jgi:glycosyltransferase involved in cell wall biosynthesis